MKKITLAIVAVFSALVAVAQPVADTLARREDDIISLEDLMKAKVTVASQNEQTLRETPGVVTIITAKEIRSMGARDLIDVLRMVPGLDFAHDIDGVIGMGIRGNWAQEAKVMLMVDGMDMTEVSYGSQQFSSHYPLDIIERIEIIRGPGSTIYGGNASLAVINIITRDAKKVNGVGAVVNYGQMKNSLGRLNTTINAGREFDNGLAIVGSFSYGTANMSDRLVNVPNIGPVNYADSSKLGQMMAVFNLKYKGLNVKYLYDNYTLQSTLINNTYLFRTNMGSISYDWKIGKKVTITPRVYIKSQLPWFYKELNDTSLYSTNVRTNRYQAGTIIRYKPVDGLELLFGGEYFHDRGAVYWDKSEVLFRGNNRTVDYFNIAGYFQAQWNSRWINATAGIRVDKHNLFGLVAVPRVVLTKVLGRFHGKLMYSKAFRAPTIYNMDLNPAINPEKTTVFEAEVGCRISDKLFTTINIFDNDIKLPIVYTFVNDTEKYINGSRLGSAGAEFELRYNDDWGSITANYSYYYGRHRKNDLYSVEGRNGLSLGLAAHKATVNTNFKLYKSLNLNISGIFYSDRYGYNSNEELVRYKPTFLLSSFIQYENIVKGLSAGIGVYDILSSNYIYPQAYRSYVDALPGPTREVVVRLRYKFSFNE